MLLLVLCDCPTSVIVQFVVWLISTRGNETLLTRGKHSQITKNSLCYCRFCVTVQFVAYVNSLCYCVLRDCPICSVCKRIVLLFALCEGPMCTKLVVVPILNVLCYCLCCVTNDEIHLKYVLSFNSMPHVLIRWHLVTL